MTEAITSADMAEYNCSICVFWDEGDEGHVDKCRLNNPVLTSPNPYVCSQGKTKYDLQIERLRKLTGGEISDSPEKREALPNAKVTCCDCRKYSRCKDDAHLNEPICRAADGGILIGTRNQACPEILEIGEDVVEKLEEKYSDGWQLYNLKDAYAEREPLVYAVKGILSVPSLAVIYGAPSSLKTMLQMDMAVCIATGKPWLLSTSPEIEAHETEKLPVLWVDEDGGLRRTSDRFKMLGKGHHAPEDAPLGYYSMPSPGLDASNPESMEKLCERIKAGGFKVVFIDCLVDVSGDVDENSAAMGMVMNNLRQLSEQTKAAIIVTHHHRKNTNGKNDQSRLGESLRGSSAIEGALDLAVHIERDHNIVTVTPTKTRDVEFNAFAAKFEYVTDKDGQTISAYFLGVPIDEGSRATENSTKLAVYDAIRRNGPTVKGKLVDRVQAIIKCTGGRSGRDYIVTTINAMLGSNELIEETGKRGAKTISIA